ncbi:MAG: hypothetical protein K6F08_00625 [bacterium]|nr:hypothetical protein [bacterium]
MLKFKCEAKMVSKNKKIGIKEVSEIYKKSLYDDKYYGLLIEAYDGLTESIGMKKVGEEDDR